MQKSQTQPQAYMKWVDALEELLLLMAMQASYDYAMEVLKRQKSCSALNALVFADDHSWDDLHQRKRKELARAEKRLEKVQEYLVSCLTMLFMTRSVRKMNLGSTQYSLRRQNDKERAEQWALEAYETASKLPRVMKYKAEKLMTVSVRPNPENWIEGDAAKAVVLIHSDIPAELRVDSLFVEMKSFSMSSSDKKGPIVSQEKPETPSVTSTPVPSGLTRAKTLTLKSNGDKIIVCP
eukprot:IDg17353t1